MIIMSYLSFRGDSLTPVHVGLQVLWVNNKMSGGRNKFHLLFTILCVICKATAENLRTASKPAFLTT